MSKVKVGVVGCGNISDIYLDNLINKFDIIEVAACADLDFKRAKEKAEKFNVKAMSVDELIADPDVQIVVNLTIPKAHAEISIAAIKTGKSVYSEKPLAITREDGRKVLELAKEKGVLVGNAPDTFMGGGLQTCRKLIDDGWIGVPIAATAFMLGRGPEGWHPNPEFFYQTGGGPMFDMGPYYLTALVNLLGPVKRVTGSANISYPQRIATSQERRGECINVEIPTHIAGIMDFEGGAVGTIITSFDVWHNQLPRIEIYGSEGSMVVPDPNTFGGPILVKRMGQDEWREMPYTHGYLGNARGIGVADMASAILTKRKHRANGDLAYHVLDLMHGFHDASNSGKHYMVESTCERPTILPTGLLEGMID